MRAPVAEAFQGEGDVSVARQVLSLLTDPWAVGCGGLGRWPPWLIMPRAMRASREEDPKAMRVMSRFLVLADSMRPLDRPGSIEAGISVS